MSVYACADLHGCLWAWRQIQKILQPNDSLYFLGDAIDRGENGWQILKEMLDDPRIIFLKGNHEDLMCKALRKFPDYLPWSSAMNDWSNNGNETTLSSIDMDDLEKVKRVLLKVRNLPICIEYTSPNGNIFWLSHAGCDYNENGLEAHSYFDLIWDRSHFISNNWHHDYPDNLYIVHGHTPIEILIEELNYYHDNIDFNSSPGAYYYAGGHKIDLDCGTVWTNFSVLLNLDTFEEIILSKNI